MSNMNKKKFAERGGLMIEALAMLGLIAVVTPTMYKKSAERTLEVEDINTATTVRTYMGAAESYMANEYATLMSDPAYFKDAPDGKAIRIDNSKLEKYLPYRFDAEKSLYDYGKPTISVVKNGTNLTAFMLFPAKAAKEADGIGQERTARIAALIGSSGGYVPADVGSGNNALQARGVGGIWGLKKSDYKNIFGADASKNPLSLVTASANVISDVNGGLLDNDKYLERINEGKDQQWRNSMRTDLYMGDHIAGDTYFTEGGDRHSIRSIKSLIVGADSVSGETLNANAAKYTGDSPYGLYIADSRAAPVATDDGGDRASAYIRGALRAANEQLAVTNTGNLNGDSSDRAQLLFGRETKDVNTFNFEVDQHGDIAANGANAILAARMEEGGGVSIGDLRKANPNADAIASSNVAFSAVYNKAAIEGGLAANSLEVTLANQNVFDIEYYNLKANDPNTQVNILYNGSAKGYNKLPPDDKTISAISYNTAPTFPVKIGANTKVDGLLATRQLDAQKIRAANIAVGAAKVDDAAHWMEVNKNGVKIHEPTTTMADGDEISTGTTLTAKKKEIALRTGTNGSTTESSDGYGLTSHISQLVLKDNGKWGALTGKATDVTLSTTSGAVNASTGSSLRLYEQSKNNGIWATSGTLRAEMNGTNKETVFYSDSETDNNNRVRFVGGHVDLQGANLRVLDAGDSTAPVFSVRGNNATEGSWKSIGGNFSDDTTKSTYNVGVHGAAVFTKNYTADAVKASKQAAHLSIGSYNSNAGVNIYANSDSNSVTGNVLVVDQSPNWFGTRSGAVMDESDQYTLLSKKYKLRNNPSGSDKMSDGSIYMRRGMVEIMPPLDKAEIGKATKADEGTGIVKASRFVANNSFGYQDSTSSASAMTKKQLKQSWKVPEILTDAQFEKYNGTGRTRYDTYMVNPAFTSVMKDIKLTTRGGARLSDILPDFINKGIYIANNTIKEDAVTRDAEKGLVFTPTTTSGSVRLLPEKITGSAGAAGDNDWTSPLLGAVPAPQCPPGYGRVITSNPVAFQMAEAGTVILKDGRPVVDQTVMGPDTLRSTSTLDDETVVQSLTNKKSQPQISKLLVDVDKYDSNGNDNGAQAHLRTDGDDVSNINQVINMGVRATSVSEAGTANTHAVYTEREQAQSYRPLTFQQNNYLKTFAVPLRKGKNWVGGADNPNEYTMGWAVLMGFIYPYNTYQKLIDELGYKKAPEFIDNYYWNLFPVRKGMLEAYITVYCYFDRTDLKGSRYNSDVVGREFERYDYIRNPSSGYAPENRTSNKVKYYNKAYRERLNDPALKYDELW